MDNCDRFILSYQGNKYLETKKYFKNFDFNQFDIIAEPFCGIFGFSRYAHERGFKGQYYLNDINKDLINCLTSLKNNFNNTIENLKSELQKYKTDRELSNDNNKSYILLKSSNSTCDRLCQISKGTTKIKNFLEKENLYNEFFNKCNLYNLEALQFIEQLPKDKKILIYFDPPYFNSHNLQYNNNIQTDLDGYKDGSYIYIDILNMFKSSNHGLILVVNHLDILHYLFKDWYIKGYSGKYQMAKKNIKKHNIYIKNIFYL